MTRILALLLGAVVALLASRASAHGFSPAMLEIREESARRYRVTWTVGSGEGPVTIEPVFVAGCRPVSAASADAAHVECTSDLAGTSVRLSGLAQSKLTAIVRFVPLGGEPSLTIAEGASDVITLPPPRDTSGRGGTMRYLRLGAEHVLSGFDHLLFVLCLAVWVRAPRSVLYVLTAFTVAHSITLAAAVLDVIRVPSAPVEVCIAASVVLLAAELARRPGVVASVGTAARIAFVAGLLHGLGFAGALADLALPRGHVASALVAFNAGVELGQVGFVAVVLSLAAAARLLFAARVHAIAARFVIFASGSVAAYALVDRIFALLARA